MRGLVIIAAVVLTLLVVIPLLVSGLLDMVYEQLYEAAKGWKPDWWPNDVLPWITEWFPSSLNITSRVWGWINSLINTIGDRLLKLGYDIGQTVRAALQAMSLPVPEDPVPLGIGILVLALVGLAYIIYRLVRG